MSLAALPACKKSGEDVGAVAQLRNPEGGLVGEATFEEVEGGVRIHFEGQNLPPGTHGFHIHQNGECMSPSFESAGDHFNPTNMQHGLENPAGPHAGDLPNLEVDINGRAEVDVIAKGVTLDQSGAASLVAGNGTALIIHADPDDQVTDPSGNAGARIACGVIRMQ
ncbi:MAG TPA: superoxide dismutase family protein [Enhygromyxa sp.]|nr:superoxide dismutase family protein [Enhygromyxa sp.]